MRLIVLLLLCIDVGIIILLLSIFNTSIFRLLSIITLHSPTLQSPQLSKYHHPGRSQGPPWADSELSGFCESLGVAIRASCGILAIIFDNVVILLGKLLLNYGKLPLFIWITMDYHTSCATVIIVLSTPTIWVHSHCLDDHITYAILFIGDYKKPW